MEEIISPLTMLAFLFIVPPILKSVVAEKEGGVKEFMRMMGLPGYLNWIGWFVVCVASSVVTNAIITGLVCIDFSAEGAVIPNTDFLVVFLLLTFYCFALIFFVFATSTFFNNGKRRNSTFFIFKKKKNKSVSHIFMYNSQHRPGGGSHRPLCHLLRALRHLHLLPGHLPGLTCTFRNIF